MKRTFWTEAEHGILRDNYPDKLTADLLAMLPGRNIRMVYQQAAALGLEKSEAFRASDKARRIVKGVAPGAVRNQFLKGHKPFNKGKRGGEYLTDKAKSGMQPTQFLKGAVPPNHKPVGYERISDGYIWVKVGEGLRQFKLKHRIVWEQRNGPIPKGINIQFKDGNRQNCSISNLYAIDRRKQMKQNTYHNWPEPLAKTVQLRGALTRQINKKLKQLSDEK